MKNPLWPLPPRCHRITSPFGNRIHPLTNKQSFHSGVDIACEQATPIRAPLDGIVEDLWMDQKNGGGLSMRIKSGDYVFGFCHLSGAEVKKGERIQRGEIIAYSGGTPKSYGAGRSTGPHLHLTLRIEGDLVDPVKNLDWGDWF